MVNCFAAPTKFKCVIMSDPVLFVACKLPDGSYKFVELPYGCEVVSIYSESHLKMCYRALVDNGLASDFEKDS